MDTYLSAFAKSFYSHGNCNREIIHVHTGNISYSLPEWFVLLSKQTVTQTIQARAI